MKGFSLLEKMTLLEITQNILSAMNSDEVTSIADTVESLQVAEEVRTAFRDLYSNHDLATFEGLVNLESPGEITTPNVLTLPENVQLLKWFKYRDTTNTDNNTGFKDLCYLDPETFTRMIIEQPRPADATDVALMPFSPVTYPINNLKAPQYYTILDDDRTLVFDSFDSASESFLTGSNSIAWAIQYKVFDLVDDFIPPIPANEFPRLLAEAKAFCFVNIKEMNNPLEEQRAHRQKVATQRRRSIVPGQQKGALSGVDYSRKR
jgi:hypothetical protein